MNTSSINHRPTVLAAATGLAGVLLTVTGNGAHAIPEPIDPAPAADRTVHTDNRYIERACFMQPLTWNDALDGPLPRCYTYVP